jgi:hypothetical protein
LKKWQSSRAVAKAQKIVDGKTWQEMSLEERIDAGLNQQYNNLAYLCRSTNYVTASDRDKAKLETAIKLLEAKKAGTSGQLSAMDQFILDFKKKREAGLKAQAH